MKRLFNASLLAVTTLVGTAILATAQQPAAAKMTTQKFAFVSNGNQLSGFIDVPGGETARAMIVIIHGYGRTDVAGRTSYYDLRSRFAEIGISTLIWDKPGCGESQGTFDADQPVESSATEVLDAIRAVRERKMPGAQKIGLWGISRAGWIAPLAITQDSKIAFWISVSGTDDKENFPYLLESNLRIEGRAEAETQRLLGEWRKGFEITSHGGTFAEYLAATQALRRDPFMLFLSAGRNEDETAFLAEQKRFRNGTFQVDKTAGLMIYVPRFEQMLGQVNVPVLAIFGEKDRNVDWRKTEALYSKTIGKNPKSSLTIKTFPGCNHNLQQARTGGIREMQEMVEHRACEGYFETMQEWMKTTIFK